LESKKSNRKSLNSIGLDAIRNNLLRRKRALWKEIVDDLEGDSVEEHRNLAEIIREEGDMGLEELRLSTAYSLIEIKENELENIEEALGRMDRGEYGRCMDCGQWIRPERLEAMPYAVRCRSCQEKWEKTAR
jgi:DnaK suppressor protein